MDIKRLVKVLDSELEGEYFVHGLKPWRHKGTCQAVSTRSSKDKDWIMEYCWEPESYFVCDLCKVVGDGIKVIKREINQDLINRYLADGDFYPEVLKADIEEYLKKK